MKNNRNKKNGGTVSDFATDKDFQRLKEKSEDLIKDVKELNIPNAEEFEELPRLKQQIVIAEMETIRDKYEQLDSFYDMEFTKFIQAGKNYKNIEEIKNNYNDLLVIFAKSSYVSMTTAERVIYGSFSKNIEKNIKEKNELLLLPKEQKDYLSSMEDNNKTTIWQFLRNTVMPIIKEIKLRLDSLDIFEEAKIIYHDYILGSFKKFNVKPSVKKEDKKEDETGDKTVDKTGDKTGDKTKETPKKVKIPERLNKQEAIDKLIALQMETSDEVVEVERIKGALQNLSKEDLLAVLKSSGFNIVDIIDMAPFKDELGTEKALKALESEEKEQKARDKIRELLPKKERLKITEKNIDSIKSKLKMKKGKDLSKESVKALKNRLNIKKTEDVEIDEPKKKKTKKEYFDMLESGPDETIDLILRKSKKGELEDKNITEIKRKIEELRTEQLGTVDKEGYIIGRGKSVKPKKLNKFQEFMKEFRTENKDMLDEKYKGIGAIQKNSQIMKQGAVEYRKRNNPQKNSQIMKQGAAEYRKRNNPQKDEYQFESHGITKGQYPNTESFNEQIQLEDSSGDELGFYANPETKNEKIKQVIGPLRENTKHINKNLKRGGNKIKKALYNASDNSDHQNIYEDILIDTVLESEKDGYIEMPEYHDSNTLSKNYSKYNNQDWFADYYFDEEGTSGVFDPKKAGSINIYDRVIEHSREGMANIRYTGTQKYIEALRKRLGVKL